MTENTSDDMPDKKVIRAAKILMQMANSTSRAMKGFTTSREEIRACFHREEALRYRVPDMAFSYTAVDGKKSVVAPLKRCTGKTLKRIRHHEILKRNKPSQFTIHSLVRDAAARLPGGAGTRADICVLVRDSQFIVEDITDSEINKVVKGALDRLHYEDDPCVKYEKQRRLWTYLHGNRQGEDFENDSS